MQAILYREISPRDALFKAACLEHSQTLAEIIACYPMSDYEKKVALYTAVCCNSLKCCEKLAAVIPGFEQFIDSHPYFLCRAAMEGFAEIVTFLFKHGADIITGGLLGYDALRKASEWGHPEVVRVLLRHGANARNKYALESAGKNVAFGLDKCGLQSAIIRELLKNGADLSVLEQEKQEDYRKLLAEYPEQKTFI